MPTLRLGDHSARVSMIQSIVGVEADGHFGPLTEKAVEAYQRRHGLIDDGIWGKRTMDAAYEDLEARGLAAEVFGRVEIVKVQVHGHDLDDLVQRKLSYRHLRLRADVAQAFISIQDELVARGGTMTTAGGTRSLTATVGRNRSAMSRHYLGGAFDLGVYTGMVDPANDPFIVCQDGERLFRVFAAVNCGGEMRELAGETRAGETISVRRRVIDFTALAEQLGFRRIRARRSSWGNVGSGRKISNPGGLEWWHFEKTPPGMVEGSSTWGDAMMGVYPWNTLKATPPWKHRHLTYGEDWR